MFVLFQITRVFGLLFGIAIGGATAFFGSGWAGGVVGVVLGITVGWLAALLPPEMLRHAILLSLRGSDSNRLNERLVHAPWLSPLIIGVLVSRGEPVEQFRNYVQSLVRSDSCARRKLGDSIRKKWFSSPAS